MLAKSVLASAILLVSIPFAHAGEANLDLYTDDSCSDLHVREFDTTYTGNSGCGAPIAVPRFRSARLNWSTGLSAVAICAEGYPCEAASLNLVGTAGVCIHSDGTFDKVQLCAS
jgi:hypothetical protein